MDDDVSESPPRADGPTGLTPWMRRRLLPLAAVLIAALCLWRTTRPPRPPSAAAIVRQALPPRDWELFDQHRHLVKFNRYLGRQPVMLRLCGTARLPEDDPVLVWLRDHFAAVQAAGWEVLAVGAARPAEIARAERESGREWPFPVLADVFERDPTPMPIHHRWGRVDPATGEPHSALFLIDRRGYVDYDAADRPIDVSNPLATLQQMFAPPPVGGPRSPGP